MHLKKGKKEFIANVPENPHINYTRNPVSGISELGKLMKIVESKLPELSIPSLIIQGSADPVVNPDSAAQIFEKIGTRQKQLVSIFSDRHGIVRGEESAPLTRAILSFFDDIFTSKNQ